MRLIAMTSPQATSDSDPKRANAVRAASALAIDRRVVLAMRR